MADVKRAPTSLTLSSYFPEIPKNGDPNANVRPKRVEDSRAPRPRNQYTSGRRKSSGDACSANDKGTQTNRPLLESLFPKKKTHPMSHKVMLLSAVLSLAKKEKISGEVESTLLYYLHKEPVIKEAEDLCPMDEDKQAIAFKDIAAKLPFPPYPLKIRGDQKSWLQKSIEEELGPGTPYLITGPEKWNRLDFGATVLFGLHLVYTNHVEKELPDKGLRFRKVGFEIPGTPTKEWFVVDLCNNLSLSDVTSQDFTARMRRLVADGKLDSELLLRFAEQFGDESTKEIVKDGTQIFLHQSPHFSSWLKLAAAHHKLGEFTILREYLVAHVLYSLQACGKRVFLKGGCSLSLGYNLINRTSEDIDIRIDPSAGVTWEVNGCENAEHSRAEYFLKLLDTMFIEDGEVELMHTKCKTTQALYHITFDLPHHPPITIVLEVMHKVAPLYIPCKIASKFHQHARDIGTLSQFKQNYDFEIACVHPWQTLYEKIHAVHQNFNKFQNRCVDGNVNAPKWIRHLGDAYNIIRKTRKTELPEDWSISRLQEELAKSRDFVTDLSPEHPTLRLELLSESERKQVDEAFEMHVEGGYYGVGEEGIVDEGERALGTPTLDEVCETVIGWLKTVPTTFVSVDKFRRFARGNYHPRGGRSHPSSSSSPSPSSASSDPNAPTSDSNFQGRSYSRNSSSYSKPYSGKKFSNSSYNKSNTYHRNNFTNSTYPSTPATVSNDTQPTPTNDEDTSSATTTPAPLSSVASLLSASPSPSPSSSPSSLSSETPNITQISRQVDSSYRLSRDFDKVTEPTHSGSNSESDDTNSNYSNYSNESAPESLALETESPSESSAENTENEFAWGTSLSLPCPPNNGRREISISSDFESVSEPASESTSESESERKSEPEFGNEVVILSSISPVSPVSPISSVSSSLSLPLVEPPHSPVLPAFNEASFGMPKRNSLPLSLSPSPSTPSSPSPQKNNSSTQVLA